jgi:hypothetical protein
VVREELVCIPGTARKSERLKHMWEDGTKWAWPGQVRRDACLDYGSHSGDEEKKSMWERFSKESQQDLVMDQRWDRGKDEKDDSDLWLEYLSRQRYPSLRQWRGTIGEKSRYLIVFWSEAWKGKSHLPLDPVKTSYPCHFQVRHLTQTISSDCHHHPNPPQLAQLTPPLVT